VFPAIGEVTFVPLPNIEFAFSLAASRRCTATITF
jgi:hypothetical protein